MLLWEGVGCSCLGKERKGVKLEGCCVVVLLLLLLLVVCEGLLLPKGGVGENRWEMEELMGGGCD